MNEINTGDTAWLLVATSLVFLMTPGLALFYGGMVRAKNVLSTLMHCFLALGIVSVQWVVIGYSLSFAPTHGGWIGGLDYTLLKGVGMEAKGTIPHLVFMLYQMMFAVITPALIAGGFAERTKLSAYVAFVILWSTLVYDPLAHWVWGPGGWLAARGALDFAGGTVVHLSAGVSALVFAIYIGPREGYPHRKAPPHNLTMTLLGAALLWFGWFGFNAGSALGANALAALAAVNTHLAAAAGALAWAAAEGIRFGKPSSLGVASGLVAGLVAITPAAGFVGPIPAILIGLAAGVACYGGVLLKGRLRYDDTLDAFGIHGVGGALGAVLTGVFAAAVWNPIVTDGNRMKLIGEQLLAVAVAGAYAAVGTLGILFVVDRLVGLRVDKNDELEGLDASLHGEVAYAFRDSPAARPVWEQEPTPAMSGITAEAPRTRSAPSSS
jgi:Amt family ammonium transporter